jgi:CubicO group peptidase (beta-lactamase class C family)
LQKIHTTNLIEKSLIKEHANFLHPLFAYVEEVQEQIAASASAVYVIQKGKVIGESYSGFQHSLKKQKLQEDSRFNVYSVRKSYIGLVTAIAIKEGKIKRIDDLVSENSVECVIL